MLIHAYKEVMTMIYSIDAELMSPKFEHALSIRIISGNNLNLYTSIPMKSNEYVVFQKNDTVNISYFYGEFHYIFNVEFSEINESENLYVFVINEVAIEKNLRKHKRELVELNALILDSKNMYYATVLDMSDKGLKLELNNQIQKKKVNIHFIGKDGISQKCKGKIVWETANNGKYYYGILTNLK